MWGGTTSPSPTCCILGPRGEPQLPSRVCLFREEGLACCSLTAFHLSFLLDVCSLEGLGGWLWAHLVLQKLGWGESEESRFFFRLERRLPGRRCAPVSRRWEPTSPSFCVGAQPAEALHQGRAGGPVQRAAAGLDVFPPPGTST